MVRKEIKVIEILELFIMFLQVKHTNLSLRSYSKNSCLHTPRLFYGTPPQPGYSTVLAT